MEDSGSDAVDEVELSVDADGRTVLENPKRFDHSTRVWHAVLPSPAIPSLISDCEKAYLKVKTTTKNAGITYETNATYWVGADAAPTTAIEQLALDIFEFHTRGHHGTFDAQRSGAEWWTQVVDADREIGFHWDRDYELQREEGFCVHPHLATVTYLTDVGGAPTVVLPAASPLDATTVAEACSGPIRHAHACWPVRGRHLAFDGRLLHGAPTALAPRPPTDATQSEPSARPASGNGSAGGRKGKRKAAGGKSQAKSTDGPDGSESTTAVRVTLLVNIWLNHIPSGADPLHEAVVTQVHLT